MKKKYFAPEMEELEVENAVLLVTSGCEDETQQETDDACVGEDVEDM
jgi:hypothetical protein